jgi:predicted phage replisome organizer/uncharacterized phage protein (TIGR02220 family)
MADAKKYYWLKLKRDFFKRHDIRIIEEMPNGKDYILFYLKLLLESIDHEGELRFSETIPYNEQMLSVITNTNVDIVKSAMQIFVDLNMIEVFEDSTIFMGEVQKLIGSETASAERVRKHRQKVQLLQCNTDETKCNTEIEIEKDIEKDKDINIVKSDKPTKPYAVIIDYLNEKVGSQFRANNKSTQQRINARLKEGYTVDDFKTVIDKMYAKWKGTEYEEYLRPQTLFSTKFESYLNMKGVITDEQIKRNVAENKFFDFVPDGLSF